MLAALNATDIGIIAGMLAVFLVLSRIGSGSSVEPKLRRIDRKLDLIIQSLGIELPETVVSGLSSEVCRMADQGEKIEAIKRHREETGVGLKEAKDAIDSYLAR